MRSIMLSLLLLLGSTSPIFAQKTKNSHYNARLCKVFKLKTELYKKHMRQDAYAYATLASYKEREKRFCTK